MIRTLSYDAAQALLERRGARLAEAECVVAPIVEDVRKRGDAALIEYARRFDGLEPERTRLEIFPQESEPAFLDLPAPFVAALRKAARHIRACSRLQLPAERWTRLADGQRVGQIVRPLEAMAAYVPSGRYPLPSTVLMTVIPAQVARVNVICVASPRPSKELLGTVCYLNVPYVYRMGGAHAIAAFAFGTDEIPRVDRIVGPGNIYVAAAKKLLAGEVAIDFIAGPTEILIIADKDADPAVLAADMLAQAEHDQDAAAILVTPFRRLAGAVSKQIEKQLENLPTAATARAAIDRNSAIVIVRSLEDAVFFSNRFAPEHLSIPDSTLLPAVMNAGSVFIGPHSPEAAGDYASGPNHVLPTGGAARFRGGLSAADFVKVISVQELSPRSLRRLEPAITTLARAEGLEAHARSVEVRTRA